MISAYEWEEYFLLVSFRNRVVNAESYLLHHVSQEEFIERVIAKYGEEPRNIPFSELTVVQLTEESYDLLEPFYPENRKME